ncbi:MAG: calcium/sodium antiporter [Clostridia bacterium]|nr:calcium/sodium antiporter [Clostridia bacterium]
METVIMYALFAVGVVLVIKGGDWFVDGASWIAEVTGIPKFIVGATIVSFATSLPEIIVSSIAAVEGHSILMEGVGDFVAASQDRVGMAIGNGVGSVICNTAMIMGIGIIFMPTEIDRKKFSRKSVLLGVSLVALLVLTRFGSLSTKGAIFLLAIFVAYIVENFKSSKSDSLDDDSDYDLPQVDKKTVTKNILSTALGGICLVGGSQLLVKGGGEIARSWGVSESIVGVTMLAIGTSLPELVTAISAIVKKQPTMSVGNVIGANIIDTAFILPLCSFIYGDTLPVSAQNIYLDFPVCILVSLIALVPTVLAKKFYRWQGVVLLLVYLVYLAIVSVGLEKYLSLFNI